MWRYLIGGVAALAMVAAGWLIFNSQAHGDAAPVAVPSAPPVSNEVAPFDQALPEASGHTREQKRFDRYDKDRDGRITRAEYLASRQKAFAKLDTDGDGRLGFDEWAIKTTKRFADADRDGSGVMDAAEFATTAPKRKAASVKCRCPSPPVVQDD